MSKSDRDRAIEALVAHYRRLLEQRLPATPQTLDQIEQTVAEVGSDMNRELERRILDQQEPPKENQTSCPHCGHTARYRATRSRLLITRHGEQNLSRRYYYCGVCRWGFAPMDALLGLDAGATSPTLRHWLAHLAAHEPFDTATATLALLTGITVSSGTVARTAIGVGTSLARAKREEADQHQAGQLMEPVAVAKPLRLYVALDGTMTPLRNTWRWDGSLGKLVCRYGECKVGVVYEADAAKDGDEGVKRKEYVATMDGVETFAALLGTAAHGMGHHWARELIVLGDGAIWIWRLAARQFPMAIEIVDFHHASEHLATVGAARYGEGTAEAKEWLKQCQEWLKADEVGRVLAAIVAWEPSTEAKRELQKREYHYFESNQERMRYGSYLKRGYHIGSGVVEGACRHVAGQRLDQVGMHWREETADAIVGLRAALLSTQPPDLRPHLALPA